MNSSRIEALASGGVAAGQGNRHRKEAWPLLVCRGSVTVKIYRSPAPPPAALASRRSAWLFTIAWHEPGPDGRTRRCRAMRSDLAAAKRKAEEKAIELANGETWRAQFGTADFYAHQRRVVETAALARELGRSSLDQDEIFRIGVATLQAERARSKIIAKTCPEIAAELLATKRRENGVGGKWLRTLEGMLHRVGEFWPGPLNLVQPADLNRFLRGLNGGLVYRRHHRGAILQLVNFAKAATYVAREQFGEDFWKLVDNPEPKPVRIVVWEPAQLVKLLARTHADMIPFTVLQAFAGIRHEELNPEEFEHGVAKVPLDWRDFDWDQNLVEIKPETGKTGARIVPLSANLIAWLLPHRQSFGRVCSVKNTANKLNAAKKRALLPSERGQSRNVLRKSFGSYRLAVVKNIGQVAEEMGNSPAKVKSNYRKPRPEAEGQRWFDIWPTEAEVLQLPLVGIK